MIGTAEPTPRTLITTYLEMTSPQQFIPGFSDLDTVRVEKMQTLDLHYYLYLYRAVGENWAWRDRLLMSREELHAALSNANVYVLYVGGAPAGYVELVKEGDSVEIAYFGLREDYQGMGLGKHLLSVGIEKAWQMGAERVWLHTCNLDAPQALSNYCKRGFQIYKHEEEPMPERYL